MRRKWFGPNFRLCLYSGLGVAANNVGNTDVLMLTCHLTVHGVRKNTREWHKFQRNGY